jgi:hypothetical protein
MVRHAHGHAREGGGRERVKVRVHEMRVDDRRLLAREASEKPRRGERVHIRVQTLVRDGHVERVAERPRALLASVQHDHPDVPSALAQRRQDGEEMRLGARDAGDL